MEYPKINLAYFAGLLDGEGCIRIGKFLNSSEEVRYRGQCQIAMTHPAPIRWLAKTFGGGIYKHHPIGVSKPCYYWQANAKDAAGLLQQALPFLKVKKEQAKLLIRFAETLTGPGGQGINKPIPASLLDRRRRMAELSTRLNAKGVAA